MNFGDIKVIHKKSLTKSLKTCFQIRELTNQTESLSKSSLVKAV
jgi:hypothetical protein